MKQEPDFNSSGDKNPATPITTGHEGWQTPLPEILPHPTAWPAALAFGSTMIGWGILTSWVISAVGLIIFIVSAAGWIRRMRDEQP